MIRIPVTGPIFAVLILLFLVPAACTREQHPVKLGFVGALTGRGADLGVAGRNGAMLAIEQRNAAGGIKGRPVELLVRDDEQSTETARRAVAELIGQNVPAIIGPMTSGMAIATVPLVNASRVIMMSPTVTTNELCGKDDNFFRVISATREYAEKNARYQFDKLGHRNAAALYDLNNKAYTECWLNDFRTTFEGLGGTMLAVQTFSSGSDTVFTGKVRELLAGKPDVMVIISNSVDAAIICQQARKIDPRVSFTLAEWATTERLLELGGKAVEGAYLDQFFNRDDTSPSFMTFLREYRQRFGMDPGFAGVAAFDATNVVLDALARKGTRQDLKEFILATGSFTGVQQKISFDRFGDARRTTYVSTIRDGRFVVKE
jgi:branched-chain amino acid transport system substrate-binding protein